MGDISTEIIIIVLLIIANGIFAMAEIAVVTARKARLKKLADEGDEKARAALELATDPNRFLATVQVGITLIGILAGAYGGATIAERLAAWLSGVPVLASHAEAISVGIVVVCITYLSLIIGELVPKRLALNSAERIASAVAGPMRLLSAMTAPLVRLLDISTDLVVRLLGIKPSAEPSVTPEEIKVLIEQGTTHGVFEEAEQEMIEGVLHIGDRRVVSLMTPRTRVVSFDIDDTPEAVLVKLKTSQRSRFPLVKDGMDNVLGIVYAKDLLAQRLGNGPFDLKAAMRPASYVSETMTALDALELFKEKGVHVALVIDEYGGVQGLITTNDIVESIVGDFTKTAGEAAEPQALRQNDGSWLIDGLLPMERLIEALDLEAPAGDYQTAGGFIMHELGSIPTKGQAFERYGYRFEVMEMERHRVSRIRAVILTA